jgi:hypothetical protein
MYKKEWVGHGALTVENGQKVECATLLYVSLSFPWSPDEFLRIVRCLCDAQEESNKNILAVSTTMT